MKIGTILGVLGAAAAVAAIAVAAPARAGDVVPVDYSFSAATDCGSFCYHDTSGEELVDGVLGNAGWANPYQPWVAWTEPTVDIDFDFGAAFTFASVAVGTTQDNPFDVVLPSLRLFSSNDGLAWTLRGAIVTPADNAHNNDPYSTAAHGFLTFSGLDFTSRYVRLTADNMGLVPNTFIFIDEVDFDGVRAGGGTVPEPSAWLMMLVGFFALGGMLRGSRAAFGA